MIANRALAIVFGVTGLACGVAAQFPSPKTLKGDFERFWEEQHKSAASEDRLHEMFYRHALGLPVDIGQLFTLTKAEAEVPRARAEENLNRTRQDVQQLIKQYEALKLQVKSVRSKLTVPTTVGPNVALPTRTPVLIKHPNGTQPMLGTTSKPRLAPRSGPRFVPGLGPDFVRRQKPRSGKPTTRPSQPVFLIKGSSNHSLVGRVLFRAGKYESAIRELLPIASHSGSDFSDLFHLALSYEKLGRQKNDRGLFAKANDLFSRLEARDSHEAEDGQLVLGQWGRAARTARQTMLWLLDEGEWKPRQDVSTIRWKKAPSEKKR